MNLQPFRIVLLFWLITGQAYAVQNDPAQRDTILPYQNPPELMSGTMEWEIPVFNMGSTFSHAEMAYLIFPRPFMVERGHDDLVQQSDWVAYEFGKVEYLYDQFGLGDKTEIEYFNGGHSMRGEGTFEFLHEHLDWPHKAKP